MAKTKEKKPAKKADTKKTESKKADIKKADAKSTSAKKGASTVAVPKIAVSKAAKQSKSDRIELLEKALRDAETKLVEAEHHLARVQQELEGERRLREDAANLTLAEAEAEEAALAVEVIEIETVEIVPAPASGDLGEVTSTPPLPTPTDASVPSLAWTLVQLRTEAKTRGLKGYSTLTKPGLVALLTA